MFQTEIPYVLRVTNYIYVPRETYYYIISREIQEWVSVILIRLHF